jgi:hypothetical protein
MYWLKVLYIISIILYIYMIYSSHLDINDLGLINGLNLPLLIFSVYILYLIIFISSNFYFFGISLLTIYVILYLLPYFFEKTPGFTYSYVVYGFTDYIIRTGHVNTILFAYHNWPGVMFLGSIMAILSNINMIHLILIYQVIIKILSLMLLYLLFSKFSSKKETVFLALLIYLVGDWTAQNYYTSPSMGILFYLLILFIFSSKFLYLEQVPAIEQLSKWHLCMLIASICIIISHLLGSIVLITNIVIISSFLRLRQIKIEINHYLFFLIIAFLSWLMFPVGDFFHKNASEFFRDVANVNSIIFSTQESVGLSGAGIEHGFIMKFKIIYLLLFCLIALLGILNCMIKKDDGKSLDTMLPLTIIITNSIFIPLIVGPYGGEIISRAFGYTSPFLAYFIAKNWSVKIIKILTILFLLISPILFPLSAYGNSKIDYVSPIEIHSIEKCYEICNLNNSFQSFTQRIWPHKYIELIKWKPLDPYIATRLWNNEKANYIAISKRDVDNYVFLQGNIPLKKINDNFNKGLNKIYDCNEFQLFYGGA